MIVEGAALFKLSFSPRSSDSRERLKNGTEFTRLSFPYSFFFPENLPGLHICSFVVSPKTSSVRDEKVIITCLKKVCPVMTCK